MGGGQFIIRSDHESLKFLLQQKLHTHLQRKETAKLMGLDYIIQYRKGRENVVVNALSRCLEEGQTAAITVITPNWYREVEESYEGDNKMKELREQLILNPNSKPEYTLNQGVIRDKGRLVIGGNETLRKKILSYLHESPVGGHLGIQNTYYKVRQIFY